MGGIGESDARRQCKPLDEHAADHPSASAAFRLRCIQSIVQTIKPAASSPKEIPGSGEPCR
jgi:hypothetical protein